MVLYFQIPLTHTVLFRFRYGGWEFGKPLPVDLKMDMLDVPQNRTLSKVILFRVFVCRSDKVSHYPSVTVYANTYRRNDNLEMKRVLSMFVLIQVWYNPEGHHSMPAYLNSLNNFLLRSSLPPEKRQKYG